MACELCSKAQDNGLCTFIRVENANVLVSGCEKHIKELIKRNRK